MAPVLHTEVRGQGGPRLVLVHGFTQTGRCWSPIDDDLARDHEVVLVDAPGHGGSSQVRAGVAGAARLLGRAGGQATYVGYSMGGRLALRLAVEHPELVERLVLIGASPGIERADERAARREADDRLATRLETIGLAAFLDEWLSQPFFAGLDERAAHRRERLRNTVEGLAASLRLAGVGTQPSLWHRLPELSMPVLLVAGSRDQKFRSQAERAGDLIGERASVAIIEGAGHAAHLERPDAFVTVVRDWLAGTPVRR
jgi:2-succinyl-6-hydroxy-2,4-cyclohexadiene-1-carboxylate synthase